MISTGCGSPPSASARLHQARPDHLLRRGPVPRRAGRASSSCAATRCRPEPFDVVREVVEADLGAHARSRSFEWFDRTPLAAASIAQVHAARAAHRRAGRRQGAAPAGRRRSCARTCGRWRGWRPHLVGRIPIAALANPPALVELFAETIVEELDFRLEAANMLDIAAVLRRARPARLRRPPPAPDARDPAGAGDGAARRASSSTTSPACRTPASTPRPWSAPG